MGRRCVAAERTILARSSWEAMATGMDDRMSEARQVRRRATVPSQVLGRPAARPIVLEAAGD